MLQNDDIPRRGLLPIHSKSPFRRFGRRGQFKKMLLHLRVKFQFNALNVLRNAEVDLPDDALEEGLLRLRGRRVQQRVELAQQLLNQLHRNWVGGRFHESLLYIGFTLKETFVLFLKLA